MLIQAVVTCSQVIGQSIREDIGAFFAKYLITKIALVVIILKMNKKRLIPSPLQIKRLETARLNAAILEYYFHKERFFLLRGWERMGCLYVFKNETQQQHNPLEISHESEFCPKAAKSLLLYLVVYTP